MVSWNVRPFCYWLEKYMVNILFLLAFLLTIYFYNLLEADILHTCDPDTLDKRD